MSKDAPKVAILMESDYYEHEIFYYDFRFKEAGIEAHFMSRLWGQSSLSFTGHEYKVPYSVSRSFESISDDELATYDAVIVPSGIVSDRLRYAERPGDVPPAAEFLRRAFGMPGVLKGIICHGLWLTAPLPGILKGRKLVCHNNLYGDALAYGAQFVDSDVVVDGDLITGRTGGHAHLFASKIIDTIKARH